MKKTISKISKNVSWLGAALTGLILGASWMAVSCSTTEQQLTVGAETGKSGAQLWAENCNRCHNIRSPSTLSGAQWEVAAMHMRVRANLTPEEHKKILEFLKQSR